MKLASVAAIRSGLGFDENADILAAIGETLDAAEPYIAARLNTPKFEKHTRVDKFYVAEPNMMQAGYGYTVFRLSSGLLTGAPSAAVRADEPSFATTTTVTLESSNPDELERGLVKDLSTVYSDEFVRITYEVGFDADEDDPTSFDLSQVPDWLQTCARLQTIIALRNHPVIEQLGLAKNNSKLELDYKGLVKQFEMAMANHIRYAPNAFMPL